MSRRNYFNPILLSLLPQFFLRLYLRLASIDQRQVLLGEYWDKISDGEGQFCIRQFDLLSPQLSVATGTLKVPGFSCR